MNRKLSYPVQSNDIVITLGGVEFDGKTSRVAGRVGELSAKSDGTESDEDWCLLAGLLEEIGFAIHMWRQLLAIYLICRCNLDALLCVGDKDVSVTYVRSPIDFVVSKYPKAPEPQG